MIFEYYFIAMSIIFIFYQQKQIFDIKLKHMFFCCGKQSDHTDALSVLNTQPQPCMRHNNKPIKFVCKSCLEEPLLCQDCMVNHRDHDWVSLQSFFNPDVMRLFETGESRNGRVISDGVDRIVTELVEYQTRIQKKIKQTLATIMMDLEKLKTKFPLQGGFKIPGNSINNRNMGEIIRIVNNQKFVFDTARLERTFSEILKASQENINENLDRMKDTLSGHDWQLLQQDQILRIQTNYLVIYKKVAPNRKFFFSFMERCRSIQMKNSRLTAVYAKQIPKYPTILCDRSFSSQNHKMGFKITGMQTHAHFINMSVVYIGVCNPTAAEQFSYLDLYKPSRGAYFISSKGKTYHSKYPQYHNSNVAFSFGLGDVVSIDINFPNGTVTFEKKSGVLPFLNKVQMRLGLQPKYLAQLKPCVMFSSNIGAEVTILNQTELTLEADGKVVYPAKKVKTY